MKFLILFFIFFTEALFAMPKEIVVVFLSETKVSFNSFKKINLLSFDLLAKNDKNCIPMGDGCFNPQLGFIKKTPGKTYKNAEKLSINEKDKSDKKLRTFNSLDVNLVDCQKGNFFDIFCGKALKNKKKKNDVEIFVDVSSSMKHVDGELSGGYCERRYFVSELKSKCKNISVSGFDTRLISSVDESRLCINYGLNDRKQAVKWIKNSDAKYLLMITDLEEYQGIFREFLDSSSSKLIGLGTVDFMASKLKNLIPNIVKKYCAK